MKQGDRVFYCMTAFDAASVNSRRAAFEQTQAHDGSHKHPHEPIPGGRSGASGYVAHIGHGITVGQRIMADVSCVNESGTLCLRVLLPGSDIHWVKNVPHGDGPGTWREAE